VGGAVSAEDWAKALTVKEKMAVEIAMEIRECFMR
jgi:hypothetical protein